MKKTGNRILSVLLALCLAAGLLAVLPVMSSAAAVTIDIGAIAAAAEEDGKNIGEEIQKAIQTALDVARLGDDIVVVGEVEDMDGILSLNIPANKKVVWKASLSQAEQAVAAWPEVPAISGTTPRVMNARIKRTSSTRATVSFWGHTGQVAGTTTALTGTSFDVYSLAVEAGAPAPDAAAMRAQGTYHGIEVRMNWAAIRAKYVQKDITLRPGDWDVYLMMDVITGAAATARTPSTPWLVEARCYGLPLVQLSGVGTFEVADGADLAAETIGVGGTNTNILVSGGKITAGSVGINSNTGRVTVTGGEVVATGEGGEVIVGGGFYAGGGGFTSELTTFEDERFMDAELRSDGAAIRMNGTFSARDEDVRTRSNRAGQSGYLLVDDQAQWPNRKIIYGVNVNTAPGNVVISGGKVESKVGNAIEIAGISNSNSVTVTGGEVIGVSSGISAMDFNLKYRTLRSPMLTPEEKDNLTFAQFFFGSCDVTVSGGTVKATDATDGTAIVTGDSYDALYNRNNQIYVQGPSGDRQTKSMPYAATKVATGNVTVSGGTIKGATAIQKVSGNLTISGGEIIATDAAVKEIASVSGVFQTENISTSAATVGTRYFPYTANTTGTTTTVTGGKITGASAFELGDGTLLIKDGEVAGGFTMNGGLAVFDAAKVAGGKDAGEGGLSVAVGIAADAATSIALEGKSDNLTVTGDGAALWDTTRGKSVIMISGAKTAQFDWGKLDLSGLVIGAPTASRASDLAGTFGFTAGTAGKVYCMLMGPTAAVPAASTVRQGTLLGDVAAGVVADRAVTLTKGAQSIFVVLQDASGNFSNVLKIEVPEFVQKYSVTVTSGTGAGSFIPGARVTVTASAPPDGQVFDKWTSLDGVIFSDAGSATTSFIMPNKSVTVKANYKTPSTVNCEYCNDVGCDICKPPIKEYVGIFGRETAYEKSRWNWFMFIVLFGWIWMWFTTPAA